MAGRKPSWAGSLALLNPLEAWRRELHGYSLGKLRQDLMAGLTVGVVALPLALAFGVTSGAGAAAGLFTPIAAGVVGSAFGGSCYITGPTGAMTVVLLPIVAQYGVDKVFLVEIMAGLLLLASGLLRLSRLVSLIPYPMVTGFTNGIAVVIFLQQVPAPLGVPTPRGEHILGVTWEALRSYSQQPQLATVLLTLLVVAVILAWGRYVRRVPGSVVALAGVTLVGLAFPGVPRVGDIPAALHAPRLPEWSLSDVSQLFSPALAVALLAGIESLLSAVVADSMTIREKHDPDRKLIGSGLANLVAPVLGGIPATGAIARTAVNVRSSGQTRPPASCTRCSCCWRCSR